MIVPLVQKATRRSLLSQHTAVESDQWCPEWYYLITADSGVGDQWHGLWLTTTSWATFGIGWGNPESKHSWVDDTGCWQCFSTYDVARVLLCFDGKTGPLSCADSSACGWGIGLKPNFETWRAMFKRVFFWSESLSKIKCLGIFLEKLYHFKVPKKVKIGEKWRCSGQVEAQWPIGYGVGLRINGPRFESGRVRCVESLDKALYSHCPKEKPSHLLLFI